MTKGASFATSLFTIDYSLFTNDAFWRVSADTKTCGSPLYLPPTGGLCLPAGKHTGILMQFQT